MEKTIIYLTGVVMVILMSGCGETKKEEALKAGETAPKTREIIREEFDTFFKRFSEDSVFQLSRIDFPISYYSVDIEDNKEEFVYDKNDFWYIDFTEDRQAATRNTDAYEPVIEKGDLKTRYIRKGIDNGIRIEYYFERNATGEWYMVEIVDNSN